VEPGTWLYSKYEYHVTLLFLGGESSDNIAKKYPELGGPAEVDSLWANLQNINGQEVNAEITALVWDDRIAAAEVSGINGLSANEYPHCTVALLDGVPPVLSNELLARRRANNDFITGLGPWLRQLHLTEYEEAVRSWCTSNGTATADDLARNATDLAAALEPHDEDHRARIKTTIAHSAPGQLREVVLQVPLKVTARIRGRRRGE